MSGLTQLFGELADEAKVYEVTEGALRGARRRRRARLLVAPAVAVVVVTAAVAAWAARPSAQGPPLQHAVVLTPTTAAGQAFPRECTARELPVPAGFQKVFVTAMDPTGRVVVGWPDADRKTSSAILWVDDVPSVLTPPGEQSAFADINSALIGVGNSVIGEGAQSRPAAWLYRAGAFTLLRGRHTSVTAINEQGQIVGTVGTRPAWWPSPDAEPQLLPVTEDGFGTALDIDTDGTIIGEMMQRPPTMYVWPPGGAARTLPEGSYHFSISNGWTAGVIDTSVPFGGRAVRWNLRTGQHETLAGELTGLHTTVNALGWVAGTTLDKKAQLVSADSKVELPLPAPGEPSVAAISDDGRKLAGTANAWPTSGRTVPLVWRCS